MELCPSRECPHSAADEGKDFRDAAVVADTMTERSALAPGQRHQRHIIRIPFTDRFRAGALESVFDRLGLSDRDMQAKQRHGDRIDPFVEAQIAHGIQQDRAGKDDQRIGEDEIFRF